MADDGLQLERCRGDGLDPSGTGIEDEVARLAFLALAAHRLAADKRAMSDGQRAPGHADRLAALEWTVTAAQGHLRRLAE